MATNGAHPTGSGKAKALCGAKASSTGRPCTREAGWGTAHVGVGRCKLHGGSTPNAQVAGAVELARRESVVMGQPLDLHPHEALLECIRISAGEVQYASERVAELEAEDAVGPVVTTHTRPLKYEKGAESTEERVQEVRREAPALHIWIMVRQRAMDRLVEYSRIALAAGVAERQVRLAEQQGQLLAQVIQGILGELGVADRPEVPSIVRRHLELVRTA